MNNMAYSLRGLSCNCSQAANNLLGLGTVYNPQGFDIITIAGKQYTADQLLDKQLIAAGNVTIYKSDLVTPIRTVRAGEVIGYVYAYRKASQTSNGKVALMMYDNPNYTGTTYWVIDDAAISSNALKSQGTLTVAQQQTAYQEQQDANDNPITHFLKTYGLKIGIGVAAVYTVVQLAKAYIDKPKAAKA